MSRLVFLRAI